MIAPSICHSCRSPLIFNSTPRTSDASKQVYTICATARLRVGSGNSKN